MFTTGTRLAVRVKRWAVAGSSLSDLQFVACKPTLEPILRKSFWIFLLTLVGVNAFADEASVRKIIEGKFQGSKLESVTKSGYGGLYEIYMDGKIGYTDEQVSFIMVGYLVDTKTSQNVTQQRLRKLTAVNVKEIPLDLGIRKVRGNGKRQLIIFSDPMCPFCRQLEIGRAHV